MGVTTADISPADYLQRARELAPELAAAADEIERRRELPEPVVAALVERGLYRLLLPRSLGGAELPPADFVPVIEEIAKADASTAWCLNQASGCSMTAAYLDPGAAREIFGGPRGILAWGPGPGTARAVDGGYRVTASWSFASGSHNATWLGCHVPVVESRRDAAPQPRRQPSHPHDAVPKIECPDDRHLACDRSQGHRQRPLFGRGSLCAAAAFGDTRRRHPARGGAALSLQQPPALRGGICRGGDGDRPQHARRLCRAGARQGAVPLGGYVARQSSDPVAGRTGRGTAFRRPRLSVAFAQGNHRRGRLRRAYHARPADGRSGSLRPLPSTSHCRSSTPPTTPPARPRSSRKTRSSVASATSTPCRSNYRGGRSISRPSGNICSASKPVDDVAVSAHGTGLAF